MYYTDLMFILIMQRPSPVTQVLWGRERESGKCLLLAWRNGEWRCLATHSRYVLSSLDIILLYHLNSQMRPININIVFYKTWNYIVQLFWYFHQFATLRWCQLYQILNIVVVHRQRGGNDVITTSRRSCPITLLKFPYFLSTVKSMCLTHTLLAMHYTNQN